MTIKISELGNLSIIRGNTVMPVVSDIGGTYTTYKANVSQLQSHILGTIPTDVQTLFANAIVQGVAITAANVGMKGYVDSTVASNVSTVNSSILAANIGMKGYVDNSTTTANIGMKGYVDNSTTTANIGMKGYVDQGNTIQASAITSANLGMKGYVDNQITSLIASAPGTLDTLNEIASALGNDANLSVTLTNLISNVSANVTALADEFDNYSPNVAVDAYYASSPLTASRGGTGLASPGTSGNVLTSNGSAWTSTTPVTGIGSDQTWQDVSATRSPDVYYTNSTGKPIQVLITTYKVGNSARTNFYVGNLIIGFTDGTGTNDVGIHSAASFIVPNSSTYKVSDSFVQWSELR